MDAWINELMEEWMDTQKMDGQINKCISILKLCYSCLVTSLHNVEIKQSNKHFHQDSAKTINKERDLEEKDLLLNSQYIAWSFK